MTWYQKVLQIFRIPEIRNKILFTLAMLIVFRLAAAIPVPGVDTEALKSFLQNNQLFGLLNIFSGGGLSNLSIVMLGVGPYITSSIIFQLLTMVIPKLERMQKEEGEEGRRKLNQITRFCTVPLAVMQTYALITLLNSGPVPLITDLTFWNLLTIIVTVTGGTIFLMWLGEMITEKGIGNGVSLLIFAGIISGIPASLQQTVAVFDPTQLIGVIGFALIAVVVIAGVVLITEGQRNIPVSYAKRVRGRRMYGGTTAHLPLRVNQAGVMPIIFAISIMLFPGVIAQFVSSVSSGWIAESAQKFADLFQNQVFYGALYFILVVLFTYFYTSVTFDPNYIAQNIQKNGGFIPGIRPGKNTADYLRRITNRITLTGALFLGIIAILPFLVQAATGLQTITLGGTALLIAVSVILETMKQLDAQLVMRDYEGLS
jgi:preprotein translocase subunit SecY